MSYLVLARKYRPSTFDEVIGQQGVIQTLKNAIRLSRVAHAYLFTGARGVGKTTVARLLAKALNCEKGPTPDPDINCSICKEISSGASPDVFEIDGASNTGVDDVRALRDNLQYMPARSRFKIYIIDEVHMLSTNAFNALLKTLEEPPAHVKFIFATTEPHKIPLTVLSRCQRFDFKRISSDELQAHIKHVLDMEKMDIDPEGIRIISRQASGSVRDALSLTDQVLAFGGEHITAEQVRMALHLTGYEVFESLISFLLDSDLEQMMRLVEKLFDEGHDLKRFIEGLLWYIHNLILFSTLDDPGDLVDLLEDERHRLRQQAAMAPVLRWHQVFDVLSRTAEEISKNPYPRLVLETALLRLSVIEPMVSVDELLTRVENLAAAINSQASSNTNTGAPPPKPFSRTRQPVQPHPRPVQNQNQQQHEAQKPDPNKEPPSQPEPKHVFAKPGSSPGAGLKGMDAWKKLVDEINSRRPSLGSFLSHARIRKVEPGQIIIAFELDSFFGEQVRLPRNKKEIQRMASTFFGCETQLSVEDAEESDSPSLAEKTDKARQKEMDEKRKLAMEHPAVQEAIRVFGAKVERVEINPEKEEEKTQ